MKNRYGYSDWMDVSIINQRQINVVVLFLIKHLSNNKHTKDNFTLGNDKHSETNTNGGSVIGRDVGTGGGPFIGRDLNQLGPDGNSTIATIGTVAIISLIVLGMVIALTVIIRERVIVDNFPQPPTTIPTDAITPASVAIAETATNTSPAPTDTPLPVSTATATSEPTPSDPSAEILPATPVPSHTNTPTVAPLPPTPVATATHTPAVVPEPPTGDLPTTDMVGWWQFDCSDENGVHDSSPNGITGRVESGSGFVEIEGGNCALEFNSATYVIFPQHRSLDVPTGTVIARIKVDKIQESEILHKTIQTTNSQVTGYGMRILADGTLQSFILAEDDIVGPWAWSCSTNGFITPGVWHELIMRWNGSTLDVIIDHTLYGSHPYTGEIQYNDTGDLQLGRKSTVAGNFEGYMDEIRIYNHALSDDEIKITGRNIVERADCARAHAG